MQNRKKRCFNLENGISGDIYVYCLLVTKKRNNNYGYTCITMGMKEKRNETEHNAKCKEDIHG